MAWATTGSVSARGTRRQHATPRVFHAPVSSKIVSPPVHERTISPSYSISVQSSGSGPNCAIPEKNTMTAKIPTAMPAMLSRVAVVRAVAYRSDRAAIGSWAGAGVGAAAVERVCSDPHVGH